MSANPYNFVPLQPTVARNKYSQIQPHCKFDLASHSGVLTCKIVTKTRMFIPSTTDIPQVGKTGHKTMSEFYYINEKGAKKYLIPGSTLKGVIRSTAEAISNSCVSMFKGEYKGKSGGKVTYALDDRYKHETCVFVKADGQTEADGICICCSMFGMANAKESAGEEEARIQNIFKGKVRITDADKTSGNFENDLISLKELSTPKPYHSQFYANGSNKTEIKGRKFYYHQPDDVGCIKQTREDNRNSSVKPLLSGAEFEFKLFFENLTDKELGLLLLTLELKPGLGHKIGMGKPIGMGSCVITVDNIEEFSKERYFDLSKGMDNKTSEKDTIKNRWTGSIPPGLKCILTLSLNAGIEVKYPGFGSYLFQENLHAPCKDFDGTPVTGTTPTANIQGNSTGQLKIPTSKSSKTPNPQKNQKPAYTGGFNPFAEAFLAAQANKKGDK